MTDVRHLAVALGAIAAVTLAHRSLHITNTTTVALSYLLVVLVTATVAARLSTAVLTSIVAMLCLNYFFLPPVGHFTIADPQNWVALGAFITVSLIAGRLSSIAQVRQREAAARRDELARLFDLSRDVLLTTDSREATSLLARYIARRFDLDYAAVCLPHRAAWNIFSAGSASIQLDEHELALAFAGASRTLEFDAHSRTYAGHRTIAVGQTTVHLVPLRLGTKTVGLLAAAGRPIEPGTFDALAGVAAIAIERADFLEERETAEVARKSEELKSALLASLGHDLRTPLTAIGVAASNLQASWLSESERREQSDVVLTEVERLTRLFEDILDMARIDAGAVASEPHWVHPSQILDVAREQVVRALSQHHVESIVESDVMVRLDPRLTASALAHLLENAARYSPSGTAITVRSRIAGGDLTIAVRDRGPGVPPADLPRLFDRFYRGSQAKAVFGTGMGLSIARGLLAVEGGRIWAENCPDGGAQFTIAVPVAHKPVEQPA